MNPQRPPTLSRTELPRPLKTFLTVYLLYTAVTWISCLVHFRLGHSQAYASPFIHQSWDSFTDLRTYIQRFNRYLHTPEFFVRFPQREFAYFSYPAAGALIYWFFYRLGHYVVIYLFLAVAWALTLTVALFRLLERRGVPRLTAAWLSLLMLALAFPLDFMIERGNVELVVWIFVFFGLLLYLRHRDNAAALYLGTAASFKIFPVIFCGILLHRRRYAALALSLLAAALVTLFALWFVGPTIPVAFHGFNQTVANYQQSYSVPARVADVGMDHSLFALIKVAAQQFGLAHASWLHPYYLVAGLLTVVLFFGRVLRLPLANQLLFIVLMAVLLPPNSFDYTLVYLYAPWTALCLVAFEAARRQVTVPGLTPLLLAFVPLLAPFSLFVRHDVRFGGQVQTLFLLLLVALDLRYPIADNLWLNHPAAATSSPLPTYGRP